MPISNFDVSGAAQAVQTDLDTHKGLTTTAHGGIVASSDSRLTDSRTPAVHAVSHKSGGTDAIALDTLAAPTDITTLNASTVAHGLLPKLSGNVGQVLVGDGSFRSTTLFNLNGLNPMGTTNKVAPVLMGLCVGYSFAPQRSGWTLILCSFACNSSAIGSGFVAELRFGTGTPPVNGAADTGTPCGGLKTFIASTVAGKAGLALIHIQNLTPSTAYWFDVAVKALTGGTATISDVNLTLLELV